MTTRLGGWVAPFPTIDPQIVLRSPRALDRYGPDFTYSHYIVVKQLAGRWSVWAGWRRGDRARASYRRPAICC